MRFKTKKKHGIPIFKKWFAIFPVTINEETRWLEFVHVRGWYARNSKNKWFWHNSEFIDKKIK